jgi:hypothetical protein
MAFKMKGSPFQRNFGIGSPLHAEEKITWKPEKKVSTTVTPNTQGGETTTTKFKTEGTSIRPSRGPAKGRKAHEIGGETYEKYKQSKILKHTKGRQEVSDTKGKEKPLKIPPRGPQPLPVPEDKPTPSAFTPKTKTKPKGGKTKPPRRKRSNKPGTVVSRTLKKITRKLKKACKGNMCTGPGVSNMRSEMGGNLKRRRKTRKRRKVMR